MLLVDFGFVLPEFHCKDDCDRPVMIEIPRPMSLPTEEFTPDYPSEDYYEIPSEDDDLERV